MNRVKIAMIGVGCISSPEHGPEIAGFLHGLQYQYQGILPQPDILEPGIFHFHLCDNPLGPFPAGDFLIYRFRHPEQADILPALCGNHFLIPSRDYFRT